MLPGYWINTYYVRNYYQCCIIITFAVIEEMKNRRAFYAAHPEVKVTSNASEERGEISEEPCASHDDYISIQLLPSRRLILRER